MKQITSSLYQISLGSVNAFLLEDNGLTLIDTGLPGTAEKVLAAIRKGGENPDDINRIILTHWHPDHAGNAAELKKRFGARLVAHADEAEIIEQGGGRRPRFLTPGVMNWLVFKLLIKKVSPQIPAVAVDECVADGDVLPGGIRVIHTPGHSAGHMALLLEEQGVLIAGDMCANVAGLAYSTVYEDIALGQRSVLKAAALPFEQVVFGHGEAVAQGANMKLKATFQGAYPEAGKALKAV